VDDLVVLVLRFEVRNLERPDGVERQDQGLISLARALPMSQVLADLSQGTENPRPIESLTLTMFAVIHHREAFFRRPSPFKISRTSSPARKISFKILAAKGQPANCEISSSV
jgi:hypothetical protein